VTGLPLVIVALAAASVPSGAPSPGAATTVVTASVGTIHADVVGHDGFDRVDSLEGLRALEARIREVADRVRPSVVLLRLAGDDGLSSGSGVVITPDGLVVTCGHVGEAAGRRVRATLPDGTTLTGRTLGQADIGMLDCGLVQLDTEGGDLPTSPLGTSSDLAPGDWLVTVGYTQGPPQSARPALVRAGRVLRCDRDELLFDAPIDSGDSGGPSFNLRGEVVGINSRCGRQPWENAATPVDRIRERMVEFGEGLDEELFLVFGAGEERDVATRFVAGGDGNGRLAVQRALPLADVARPALASMLEVLTGERDDEPLSYATVIDADGHAVTKRSQLRGANVGSEAWVRDAKGARHHARVVAVDPALDLAMLEAPGLEAPAIQWATGAPVAPGQVLLTPRLGDQPPALGFAAIERRESERDPMAGPYLGVMSEAMTKQEAADAGVEQGVRIVQVVPGKPADEAGIKVGDVIVAVDGAPVSGRDGLRRRLLERAIGERVGIELVRGGERMRIEAELAPRPDEGPRRRGPRGAARGNTVTPISGRSSGFGEVMAHDAIVRPTQCGGPVVDLDGRALGLNIARYDRTATHALDAVRVEAAVRRMMAKAQSQRTVPASAPDSAADPAGAPDANAP
jgi:serine protease Do